MNKIAMVFMIALASVAYSYAGQIEECKLKKKKSIGCDVDRHILLHRTYLEDIPSGIPHYANICSYVAVCPSSFEDARFKEYSNRMNNNPKIWHCFNEKVGEHVFFTGEKRTTCPTPADLKPTRAEIDAWSKELKERQEKASVEQAKWREEYRKRKEEREKELQKFVTEQEKRLEEYRIKNSKFKIEYFKKYGYTFVDARDGRQYRAVKIGQQEWMAENLNYATPSSYCWVKDNENCNVAGRFYLGSELENICPSGWHLPSGEDFERLKSYVLNDCENDGISQRPSLDDCIVDRLFVGKDGVDYGSGCDAFAFSAQRYLGEDEFYGVEPFISRTKKGDIHFWCQPREDYSGRMEYCKSWGALVNYSSFSEPAPATVRCIRNAGTTGLQTRDENSDNNSVENEPQQSSDICAKLVNEAKKIYEKCTSLQKGTPERSECVKLYNSRKQLAQKKCRIGGEN